MPVIDQKIGDRYAAYNGDCNEVMNKLQDNSIHLSVYSPPFAHSGGGLYQYSSDSRDLSNCTDYNQFFEHYNFIVEQISRITIPGRMTAVHCTDIPSGNTGNDHLIDFPGDIIRLHEKYNFNYIARHVIWKEPLWVRNRTMAKVLAHRTIVDDAAYAGVANADYIIIFRKKGKNEIPISHPIGFGYYSGAQPIPKNLKRYKGWTGDQKQNLLSHWIWRRYASSIWDDIDIGNVLPYNDHKDPEGEKHVHPLQLDVIDRCIELRSNPGEIILDPFGGIGSTPYSALKYNRKSIAVELKTSYYNQMILNIEKALQNGFNKDEQFDLEFDETSELESEIME